MLECFKSKSDTKEKLRTESTEKTDEQFLGRGGIGLREVFSDCLKVDREGGRQIVVGFQ